MLDLILQNLAWIHVCSLQFSQKLFIFLRSFGITQIFASDYFYKSYFFSLKVISRNSIQVKPLFFHIILALDHSSRAMPTPAHFCLRPLRSGHLSGYFFCKTSQVGPLLLRLILALHQSGWA
jgi:hypothetical protein